MKLLLTFTFMTIFPISGFGQDITVHVVNDDTKKPLKGIFLDLRVDCENPNRPEASQEKTNSLGTAVFHSVSIAGEPVCIDLFSIVYAYAPRQLDYVFVSSEKAYLYHKSLNPIITELPAEVTFHVLKRTMGERLYFMFRGD